MHSGWDGARFRLLLQQVMADVGLTQQQDIADLASVSRPQVSRWLSGAHRPGFDALQRLAVALRERRPDLGPAVSEMIQAAGYDGTVQDASPPVGPGDTPPEAEAPDPVKLLLPPDQYEALTPSMRDRMREALEADARTYAEMMRPPA